MSNIKITTPRAAVQVRSTTRRFGDEISPGVMITSGRSRVFAHYAYLREVADALHDACDEFEQAEREGRLGEGATE